MKMYLMPDGFSAACIIYPWRVNATFLTKRGLALTNFLKEEA